MSDETKRWEPEALGLEDSIWRIHVGQNQWIVDDIRKLLMRDLAKAHAAGFAEGLEKAALQVEHLPTVGFHAAKRIRALKEPK